MQPLDQAVISAFKAYYRRCLLRYVAEEIEYHRDPLQTFNLLKTIEVVIEAWSEVTETTITNCWNHSALVKLSTFRATPSVLQPISPKVNEVI